MNYTGRLRDVSVVAHELGHGLHACLAQPRGELQAHSPLTLAETASVFAEMLTFQKLLNRQQDPKARLALLCSKLEDSFVTVFRQACLTRFEQKLHEAWRKQGELTAETIGRLWMSANEAMFQDSVKLTPDYALWWCYIPHFLRSPFYCYAYAFGELLVLSLYAQYRQQGETFVPKYLEMLAAGGSESPEVLTARLGLDITRPAFWKKGMRLLEEMLSEAEDLAELVLETPNGRASKPMRAGKGGARNARGKTQGKTKAPAKRKKKWTS